MQLSVATNFDEALLRGLRRYPVVEVFGKLPRDEVGGGRPSYLVGSVSRRRFEDHVRLARALGLEFNYLLNPACLDNREFTRQGQRALMGLLEWLVRCGVTRVTVSLPSLCELIKARFPEFQVQVGVFARVATVQQARFWEALGADGITLDPLVVNRDMKTLAAIRASVRCSLQLIPNSDCLLYCPLASYHMVGLSHASQRHHRAGAVPVDYCFLTCSGLKLEDPVHYIRANWIRPEDIELYIAMGFTRFKILERGAPTEVMLRRVRAYAERRYDGNLLDLIDPLAGRRPGDLERHIVGAAAWRGLVRYLRPGGRRTWADLRRLAELRVRLADPERPGVFLDNRRLEGFLTQFPTTTCGARDCALCGYCHAWAERALRVDPEYRRQYQEAERPVRERLRTGALWRSA